MVDRLGPVLDFRGTVKRKDVLVQVPKSKGGGKEISVPLLKVNRVSGTAGQKNLIQPIREPS